LYFIITPSYKLIYADTLTELLYKQRYSCCFILCRLWHRTFW